jgi:hypothetical protein
MSEGRIAHASRAGPAFLVIQNDSGSRVDAWSIHRLPFEPTGTMLQFRAELRTAVSRLAAKPEQALTATYTSEVAGQFDVENVLLYNVGAPAFARSATFELVVERISRPVPIAPPPIERAAHHHAYAITDRDRPWQAWSGAQQLAAFESEMMATLADAGRPSSVWLAVRRGTTRLAALDASSAFGLELELVVPSTVRLNLAAMAKPLIDGVIGAFHTHDHPASLDVVAGRVAARAGAPVSEVRTLLTDNEAAILGSRRLLWPWRDGVQWNPADDCCMAFRIRVSRGSSDRGIRDVRIRGSLLAIAPASA